MFLYVISFSYVFVANREFTISSFWGHPGCEVAHLSVGSKAPEGSSWPLAGSRASGHVAFQRPDQAGNGPPDFGFCNLQSPLCSQRGV